MTDPFDINLGPPAGYWMVLDAATPILNLAIFKESECLAVQQSEQAATDGLFPLCRQLLDQTDIDLKQISSLCYCRGPGSILGIRLTLMSVKTWSKVLGLTNSQIFNYSSLHLASACIGSKNLDRKEKWIVSSWKKGFWNALRLNNLRSDHTIEIWEDKKLSINAEDCIEFEQKKSWGNKVKLARFEGYDISILGQENVFAKTVSHSQLEEVYHPAPDQFVKWSGKRHK